MVSRFVSCVSHAAVRSRERHPRLVVVVDEIMSSQDLLEAETEVGSL